MMGRGLLGIEDLERADIESILETAKHMQEIGQRDVKKVPTLRGRTIVNLFFEPSTRTRTSFEIAGKRLSADVVNFTPASSSLTKAETILDTAKNLDAMAPDVVVVRSGLMAPSWWTRASTAWAYVIAVQLIIAASLFVSKIES